MEKRSGRELAGHTDSLVLGQYLYERFDRDRVNSWTEPDTATIQSTLLFLATTGRRRHFKRVQQRSIHFVIDSEREFWSTATV